MDASPTENTPKTATEPGFFQPAEVHAYRLSPFGFRLTTLLIFAVLYGAYILIAELSSGPSLFETGPDGQVLLTRVAWIAIVLSLIFTAGTAFTENGMRLWALEADDLAAALGGAGAEEARKLPLGIPVSWRGRYVILFLAGAAAGLGFNVFMILGNGFTISGYLGSVGLWFLLVSPFLYGIGFRAGADVARESGVLKAIIREHLEVDLFHLDQLEVFGRIGLRSARTWMIMAAIILLFLINPNAPDELFATDQLGMTIPVVTASVLGGLFLLASALYPVHAKIRAAKQAELDRIHGEMAQMRDKALSGDAEAASALAGLTDYEIWVNNLREWPVSASVTTRFSLYILLPVIPIVGSYLFENLADRLVSGGV
ncbi:hypothetical protein [Maricaulis parjimensis]|uniref:hypothetical protein n=1 Tax=Maricaulis parjimensis TaxID=144023 RepID=UPI00193ADCB0|nr:hypothetical protein [Maricaulis parjimensis]